MALVRKTHLTFDPWDGNLNQYHTLQPDFAKYYGAYTRDIQDAAVSWNGKINDPMLLPDQTKGYATLGVGSGGPQPSTVPNAVEVNPEWAAGPSENHLTAPAKKTEHVRPGSSELEPHGPLPQGPLPEISIVLNGGSINIE